MSRRAGTRLSSQGESNPTAGKTREELLRVVISTVHNVATTKEYLERKCLVITGEKYSPTNLSMALLHLSQTSALSKVLVDGLRAIAFVLEDMVTDQIVEKVTNAVIDQLTTVTANLESTTTDLKQTTDNLHGAAVSITRTVDKFTENSTSLLDYLTSIASDVAKAAEDLESVRQPPNSPPMPPSSLPSTLTYAVAAGIHLHPSHATTLAQGDACSCQVLVDKAPGAGASGLEKLSENELVEKAKLAYGQLVQMNGEAETQINFVGARKLRNGGVIYELGSVEAVQWIKSQTNMTNFLQVFSATSVIKQRAYSIIVEYISLTFEPTNRDQLAEIEKVNSLNRNKILSTK